LADFSSVVISYFDIILMKSIGCTLLHFPSHIEETCSVAVAHLGPQFSLAAQTNAHEFFIATKEV